jgi:hypothetical protein
MYLEHVREGTDDRVVGAVAGIRFPSRESLV